MAKHPVLQMSKARKEIWLKEATQEDYFDMLELLTALYAKKSYKEAQKTDLTERFKGDILLVDYQEHLKQLSGGENDDLHSW